MPSREELFNRSISVTVGTMDVLGLRTIFHVTKDLEPEPNVCQLQIYNLNADHRGQLQDLGPKKDALRGIPVRLEAGYGERLSQIWLGDLRTVTSYYDKPNWITVLGSGDGEKASKDSRIAVPMGPKTNLAVALRAIVKKLGVGEGNIEQLAERISQGKSGKIITHGKVFHGPTARVLHDFAESADLEYSIQDGAIQLLDRGKAKSEKAILLNSSTGMVGSPSVDNEGNLSVPTLIIPDMNPGSLLVVEGKAIQGNFRAEKVEWVGDTHGQDWNCYVGGRRY